SDHRAGRRHRRMAGHAGTVARAYAGWPGTGQDMKPGLLMCWLLALCSLPIIAHALPDTRPPTLSSASVLSLDADQVCADPVSLPRPLTLAAAVERALCANPRTAQAWAWVQRDAAQVDVARGAYLPQLDARGSLSRASQEVRYTDIDGFDSSLHARSSTVGLSLSWV